MALPKILTLYIKMPRTFWKPIKPFVLEIGKRKRNPTVLGITAYFHNSSACIVKDGKIIAAAEEERFTRIKHDNRFPIHAINYCLKEAAIEKVDAVAFFEDPNEKYLRILETVRKNPSAFEIASNIKTAWEEQKSARKIQEKFNQLTGLNNEIIFLKHHLSHAASAYYLSGFKEAAILTIDGVGEKLTATVGYGVDKRINLKKGINYPHSIGLLYTALTVFLGFKANVDEYKVMGLASYGNRDPKKNLLYKRLKKAITISGDGSFELNMQYFGHEKLGEKAYTKKLESLLRMKPRKSGSKITKRYQDLAASLQMITEEIVLKMLNYLYHETKYENVCLAGGVAFNSTLNGKILSQTPFKRVFIQPATGDAGTSMGAAKYLQYHLDPRAPYEHFMHSYLGPSFSDKEIRAFLDKNRIKYRSFSTKRKLLNETVRLLVAKNVVGWFQGRMEWGPRALGNRSILASPIPKDMQYTLNLKVKHRELFRPFAPAVCAEDAPNWFECDLPIPEPTDYMLMVYPIRKEKIDKIPTVTHVDQTGRLQTVKKEQNPIFYQLIKQFGRKTGVPILVNTSFNVRGEPIVCTPEDAYRCMMGTGIDYLIIGNFLIKRNDNLQDAWKSK